jgi:MinD superfamily P-loop ATPase
VHARLYPGEENSGKLVEKVRSVASAIAERERAAWILIDGPPGTGCAAKSAVTGADYVILVGEPSVSGVHDVARAADLAAQFGIPCGLIVNKSTLSERQVERLHALAAERGIDILGSIPYARSVTESITSLRPYPQDNEHDEISLELRSIWAKLSAAGERSARAG